MSLIEVRGATRRFGRENAGVGPVDLQVESGEFVAVVGPSDCGKSVLLQLIGGLQPCDDGEVLVGGRTVRGPSADRQIVFQDGALFPWLTVEENVAYGLHARGDDPEIVAGEVEELLQIVDLEKVAHLYPRALSVSMRQRTAIARALILRPSVLLLDDPLAALDEVTRSMLHRELIALWKSIGSSTVFVTNNVREACLLGDRVVMMTPAPGRVADVLEIEHNRPRSATEVAPYVDRIGDKLRALAAQGAHERESLAGTLVYRDPHRRLG